MKFERIKAQAFGRLESFDTGEEPLTSFIVVSGPNESGKTTFFNIISSLIYGIYPTSPDQHPYKPWNGLDMGIEAHIRLDNNELWNVSRRLRTSPSGYITIGDREGKIRNETLPCIPSDIPREAFHQVFALTNTEMSTLESDAWSDIQDRLMGTMGTTDLTSPRDVAKNLEEEANRLWRPDRRGNQKIRELQAERQKIFTLRREALALNKSLREKTEELEQIKKELKRVKANREEQRLLGRQANKLFPIIKAQKRIAELHEEAGSFKDLAKIPSDPEGTYDRLVTEESKLEERIENALRESEGLREQAVNSGGDKKDTFLIPLFIGSLSCLALIALLLNHIGGHLASLIGTVMALVPLVWAMHTKMQATKIATKASESVLRELEKADSNIKGYESELESCRKELRILRDAVGNLRENDLTAGFKEAGKRQKARELAEKILKDLTRDHPDLHKIENELSELKDSNRNEMGDDEIEAIQKTIQEQSDRIEELTGREKELDYECIRIKERATVDQIDGEIQALEIDLDHLRAEHDRKLLLAHLIRKADHLFRDQHQPDVVRKASGHLDTITNGKYHRITVGEENDFYVRGAETNNIIEAETLSKATQEQLYLAIRFGVMRHLDECKERLPIIVDEAFVSWDASRRIQGFKLLQKISHTRQIFIMTCHLPWAYELVEYGAQRINLE